MPIPPSPALDETITPGQLGHIADHEEIHTALNGGLGVVTDAVVFVSKGAYGNDSNNGTSTASPMLTIAAAMAALPATGGEIRLGYGTWSEPVVVDKDYVTIKGVGPVLSRISITGTQVGIDGNDDPTTIRRGLRVEDLDVYGQAASAGAIGIRLDNVYGAIFRNVHSNLLGVNGDAIKLIGGTSKSCYLNEFHSCTFISAGIVLNIGNGCNENKWFGGYVTGTGQAIVCAPTINDAANTTGECKWFGTVFEAGVSAGAFGTLGGGVGPVNNFEFHGCRFEPATSTLTINSNVSNTLFMGGSKAGTLTITDNGTNTRQMFADGTVTTFNIGAATTSTFQVRTSLIVGRDTAAANALINGPAGAQRSILFTTALSNRWQVYADSGAEGGSNAGSDFNVAGYTDAGGALATYLTIRRSDGRFTINGLLLTKASASGVAGFRVPHGAAPSSPVDGDIWTTTAGLFVRVNGSTVGPLS